MRVFRRHQSDIQAFATTWFVWAKILVLLARRTLRFDVTNPRKALYDAETLQLWARSAAIEITQFTAATTPYAADPEDISALEDLQAYANALLMLAMVLQLLQRRLQAMLNALVGLAVRYDAGLAGIWSVRRAEPVCRSPLIGGYFDTS